MAGWTVPLERRIAMPDDNFYLDEYKSLRDEVGTKLKARLDFHNWGLIGLAALYSYIFTNLDKWWSIPLFLVPVGLCASMVAHLLEEHRMVAKAGRYIREEIEPWAAGKPGAKPKGWETYLELTAHQIEPRRWNWSPVPLWCVLTVVTALIAVGMSAAWFAGYRLPQAGDKTATESKIEKTIDTKIATGLQAWETVFQVQLGGRLTDLTAKIDEERKTIDQRLDGFAQTINSASFGAIVKALLSTDELRGILGPISISIGGGGKEPTKDCGGSACGAPNCCAPTGCAPNCCSQQPPAGSTSAHGRSRQFMEICH
jgi:hypothetical protein